MKTITEKPKTKLKRFVFFSFLAVIVAILALPIGSSLSQGLSGHGSSELYANQVAFAALGLNNGTSTALPFSLVNGTATISNTYIVAGANNTTVYANYGTDYIVSNISMNQLNEHSVNQYFSAISQASNLTTILGFGTYSNTANGTSLKFTPLLSGNFTGHNGTANISFTLNPAMLTENSTDVLILEIQNVNASSFSFSGYVVGTSQSQPWYLVGENSAYIAGGILLFAFGFLAMPHHDISIKKAREPLMRGPTKKTGGKKTMQKNRIDKKGGKR